MVAREFLGWDTPFLPLLVEWLWQRHDTMPGMLVVLPTAQAGRRLREALAEKGGGLIPRVVTPGHFLRTEGAAPESIERLAWVEVFEAIGDWAPYQEAFPLPPGEGENPGWALGLAGSMTQLRTSLQEGGLTIAAAAKRLATTVEAARWQALADLETRVERQLDAWGLVSRSSILARRAPEWAEGTREVVLAGVPDLPPVTVSLLGRAPVPVNALIGAPPEEAVHFDEIGRPLLYDGDNKYIPFWNDRPIPWPTHGSVTLTADPRQQASEAVRLASEAATPSDQLALGTADEETAAELVRAFGRAGWALHDPSHFPPQPVMAWLAAWRNFIARPTAPAATDLLGFSQTTWLVGGKRAQRAVAMSNARDSWLAKDRSDLERALAQATREPDQEALRLAVETIVLLESEARAFLEAGFHTGLAALLDRIDPRHQDTTALHDWLDATASMATRIRRDAVFWLDLLLATRPEAVAVPPEDRVLDVQGWLELFHEPGPHLIICGMNEGKVPGRASTDAWLPETPRGMLGLSTDATRAARDAYLLLAMTAARRSQGRVDLLLAKGGSGGDALLPSRLLLAASESELPSRVTTLFHELEPPDAGLAWTLDEPWKWRPRTTAWKEKISVTSFADYLACPFRFYLKNVLRMSSPEPDRVEWNARDFGNVIHIVLERWGVDKTACETDDPAVIEAWVHRELAKVVHERFGDKPPLAVRIQSESMRQRLSWFALTQAREYAAGWHISEIEAPFSMEIEGIPISGRVDRIEKHLDGRKRVLDYKTGAVKAAEAAHRSGISANTKLPAHLENVPEILTTGADGKPKRWKNLQLALYCAALKDVDEVGYFNLGATESDVKLSIWEKFDHTDLESAVACAAWVISQAKDNIFWPPAERVEHEDFEALALGRTLAETVVPEGGAA